MKSEDVIKGIEKIARRVLPNDAEAILFGSRARGDARDDSDWDLLILLNTERTSSEDFNAYAYPFVDFGWSAGEQINPIIYSFDQWQKRSLTMLYKNINSEGIKLCH